MWQVSPDQTELIAKLNIQTKDIVSIDYDEVFKGIVIVSKGSVELFGDDGSKKNVAFDQNFEHAPISKGKIL